VDLRGEASSLIGVPFVRLLLELEECPATPPKRLSIDDAAQIQPQQISNQIIPKTPSSSSSSRTKGTPISEDSSPRRSTLLDYLIKQSIRKDMQVQSFVSPQRSPSPRSRRPMSKHSSEKKLPTSNETIVSYFDKKETRRNSTIQTIPNKLPQQESYEKSEKLFQLMKKPIERAQASNLNRGIKKKMSLKKIEKVGNIQDIATYFLQPTSSLDTKVVKSTPATPLLSKMIDTPKTIYNKKKRLNHQRDCEGEDSDDDIQDFATKKRILSKENKNPNGREVVMVSKKDRYFQQKMRTEDKGHQGLMGKVVSKLSNVLSMVPSMVPKNLLGYFQDRKATVERETHVRQGLRG